MAKGDVYDCRRFAWQLRENADGSVFVRYDTNPINGSNKGRYNTSSLVAAEEVADTIRVTTRSGSIYYFNKDQIAYPMHLISLGIRFGVKF